MLSHLANASRNPISRAPAPNHSFLSILRYLHTNRHHRNDRDDDHFSEEESTSLQLSPPLFGSILKQMKTGMPYLLAPIPVYGALFPSSAPLLCLMSLTQAKRLRKA
jgi:hypothetical protein